MQTNETKRSALPLNWVLVAATAVAVLVGYRHYFRDKIEVRTSRVTHQNLLSSVSTNGKVEPVEPFQAHAPSPGVVKRIFVEIGDKVTPGTLLIKLDDAEATSKIASARSTLSAAQSSALDMLHGGTQDERIAISGDLERARLQQAQAERDVAALVQLEQHGAASANEIAGARQRLASAESSLRSLQQRSTDRYGEADRSRSAAQIADARAAIDAARASYSASNIRSPISGDRLRGARVGI